MIRAQKAEEIIEHAIGYANGKAQGVEVTVTGSDIATSRFANNSMTQNQAPDRSEVSVRVIKGGKQLRLSTDNLTPASYCGLIDRALETLKYLEKDSELQALPAPPAQAYPQVNRFKKASAESGADKRAGAVRQIIALARKEGLSAAGVVSSGASYTAIGNSKGLFASHKESYAECSITMDKNGSTGWVKSEELDFASLDFSALAKCAAAKALANRDPVEIQPGKYRVILEPAAVLDLLLYLCPDFTATSHIDKLSCFVGQLGKKVFGDNISIVDDCTHELQSGAPFDGEGLPRKSVSLVENGILKNLVYGRRSAKKLGVKPTGHGLAEPNAEGEMPVNLVVAGGSKSLEELIANEERAILLTRVWYIREVDPALKIVTGMTRDGTFLVENGKITSAVKNLRFNQSLIELLNNVVEMGVAKRTSGGEEWPAQVIPPMLVDRFNFSSLTEF